MSDRLRFFLSTELAPSTPPAVFDWIRSWIAGESPAPTFETTELVTKMAGDAGWLLRASRGSLEASAGRWTVTAHLPNLSDKAVSGAYGLPFLLAPYATEGLMAVMWTDLAPDVSPTLFYAQDGVPWVGQVHGIPLPAVDGTPPPYLVWRLGHRPPKVEDMARLGVPDPEAVLATEEAAGEPTLARYLLGRSVVRALRDLDLDRLAGGADVSAVERARLRAAADAGARLALDAIDAGGDPLVVRDTPGWQLQEVQAMQRWSSQPPRASGRALCNLAACLDEVPTDALDAGPKRLVEGETITTLAPLPLGAHGPLIWSTDDRDQPVGTNHILTLEVPPGERLVLTKVFQKGHAECRPVNGDFSPWIRPDPRRPAGSQPDELVAPAGEYTVGFVNPADEGRLFERHQ